jgi:hypothetical protein
VLHSVLSPSRHFYENSYSLEGYVILKKLVLFARESPGGMRSARTPENVAAARTALIPLVSMRCR